MLREEVQIALREAAAPALRRIRADAARVREPLKSVLLHLERNLFKQGLKIEKVFVEAGARAHRHWDEFSRATGRQPKVYVDRLRTRTAERMLRHTSFSVEDIAEAVGYSSSSVFGRLFKKLKKKRPMDARREALSGECSPSLWRLGEDGELDTRAKSDDFLDDAVALNPLLQGSVIRLARRLQPESEVVIVDGIGGDRLKAEGLWARIRDLPFEEQCRRLRGIRFKSTILFDLLREESRLEGRRDRQRGIEVAKLALLSLEMSAEFLGDRIHDQRALGYAWLGNAYRLAADLLRAVEAFEKCDREWSHPQAPHEPATAALIYLCKGTFRLFQRNYDEAYELIELSIDRFREVGDQHGEARALIQHATTDGFRGAFERSAATLEAAADLIDPDQDRHLAFTACTNLANSLTGARRFRSATETLRIATRLNDNFDYPLGSHEIDWVHGNIRRGLGDNAGAKRFFMAAWSGFLGANEDRKVALTSLDLACLHSEAGEWHEAAQFVSKALPILGSMKLHEETLEALALLSRAAQADELSAELVSKVRDTVKKDPLVDTSPIPEDREERPILGR